MVSTRRRKGNQAKHLFADMNPINFISQLTLISLKNHSSYYGGIFLYQFADGCLLVSAETDLQQDLGLLSRPTRVHAEVDYLGQLTLHAKPFSSTTPDSHSVPHHFVTLGQSRNCPEHSITSIQDPASSILACLPLKACPGDF